MPKGEMISRIADVFHVSADYLLGRTDDPKDYTKLSQGHENDQTQEFVRFQMLWQQLDHEDRIRLEGVVQGLLCAEKYKNAELAAEKERV